MRILFTGLRRKRGRTLLAGGRQIEIIGSFCEQGKPKISTWSYRHLNITFSIVYLLMSPPPKTPKGRTEMPPEEVLSPELALNPKPAVVFTSAAKAVLLPEAKPGAMGEQFVMSSIRGREVARAQRSMVWLREDSLQALDFGNGLLGVHPPQYPT
jgi:hypothetical protein